MAYEDIIESASKQFSLDTDLIKAHIKAESNWDPKALRKENGDYSYGLMQVMLPTARWLLNKPKLKSEELIQPTVNILVGAKYIRYNLDRYPKKLEDAIASYNSGSPKFTKTGQYINQKYVDRVMGFYKGYKKGTAQVMDVLTGTGSNLTYILGGLIFGGVLFYSLSKPSR